MKGKKSKALLLVVMLLAGIKASSCGFDTGAGEYEQGVLAYEEGEYEKAAEHFARALESNGDRAEYYLYYGFALIELHGYEKAVECFEAIIQDKDVAIIKENNKKAYRGAGIAYYLQGEDEKALSAFSAAEEIEELPELDADIRDYKMLLQLRKLALLREQGAIKEALELCDLLTKEREIPGIDRIRADFFMELGEYENAVKGFDEAISKGDRSIGTLLGKQQALWALGRSEEAHETAGQLAAAVPENDREAMAVAIAAFVTGDYARAAALFGELHEKEALEEAETAEAGYFLAQIAIMEEDYALAKACLAEWEALLFGDVPFTDRHIIGQRMEEIDYAGFYYQMTCCCIELEEIDSALEYYQKLAALQDASYQRKQDKLYIVLLEHQGKWAEALEKMEHYMESYLSPEDEEYMQAQKEYQFLRTR